MTATRRVIMFIMSRLLEAPTENEIAEGRRERKGWEGFKLKKKKKNGGKWRLDFLRSAHGIGGRSCGLLEV